MCPDRLADGLTKCSEFLNNYSDLTNCHMVDFITEDLFARFIPASSQETLLQLDHGSLTHLSCSTNDEDLNGMDLDKELRDYLVRCRECTLEKLLSDSGFLRSLTAVAENVVDLNLNFEIYMSPKKSHEVARLSRLVVALCEQFDVKKVVDFGSGRGYVSSILALVYDLVVFGLDGSATNTESETNDPVILCGLHACGDLTNFAIDAFLKSNRCKILCVVGCCYHFLDEKYANHNDARPRILTNNTESSFGFPLSCHLNDIKMTLGRNARILSCQAVAKIAVNCEAPNKSLFWRALMQQIILEKCPSVDIKQLVVGRMGKNCKSIGDYVHRAVSELNLPLKISDEEIANYEIQFAEFENKLSAFYQYRATLSTCVESLIILDRLDYLKQQISDEEIANYEIQFAEFENKLSAFYQYRATLSTCVESLIILDRLDYLKQQVYCLI